MKTILLGAAAVAIAFGSAKAADMPAQVSKAPIAAARCANFGGVYLGGQVGWAYYDHQWTDRDGWATDSDTQLPQTVRSSKDGVTAGGQLGYNYQTGCTVFGVEADYSWASIRNSTFNSDSDPAFGLDTLATTSRLRGFGTIRTRSGVIVDNLLLYLTGGLAYGNFDRSYTLTDNIGLVFVSETFASRKWKWGWTAGFGTEWAFNANWSVKSEVLYAHFQDDQTTFTSVLNGLPPRRFDHMDSIWTTRIGLNYRFN